MKILVVEKESGKSWFELLLLFDLFIDKDELYVLLDLLFLFFFFEFLLWEFKILVFNLEEDIGNRNCVFLLVESDDSSKVGVVFFFDLCGVWWKYELEMLCIVFFFSFFL